MHYKQDGKSTFQTNNFANMAQTNQQSTSWLNLVNAKELPAFVDTFIRNTEINLPSDKTQNTAQQSRYKLTQDHVQDYEFVRKMYEKELRSQK